MHPQVTRLVLIRHGESRTSVARAIGGPRTCSGLSELGVQQCERLRDRIASTDGFDGAVLYASAYKRAIETAEVVAPALGSDEVQVEDGFGEHDPGPDCDGLTFDEFVERHGQPDWESDPDAVTFPGGETVAQFHRRVHQAMDDVLAGHLGATVVVCCHGGVVNAILRRVLGTAMTGTFELYTTNASITELLLVREGRWRLLRYNDSGHLAGLPAYTSRQ